MQLIFATQNQNKAAEIQHLMPEGIQILSLKDIDCTDDIPETADTLEGNAQLKARWISEKYKVNCFADDTGLEVSTLNGEPGVFSARYAGEQRSDSDNINLLLLNLNSKTDRSAQFRTSICLIIDGKEFIFEGIVKGEIQENRSGDNGFGYDPVFVPEQLGKTFAEMKMDEKNQYSHRARAFQKMISFLKESEI